MKKYRKKRYRNEIRVNSNRKRIISLAMVWVLCLMLLPASAFAAEDSGAAIGTGGLCAHHTEHDDTCGYVEGIAESPCTHEHSEDCYTEVTSCTHEHTRECYPAEDSSIPEDGTTSSEDESVADTMSSDNKSVEDTMPSDDESGKDTTLPEAADPTQCSHVCSVESGCIKQELNCKHEHNEECGYAPAVEGQPCTYVCALCGMTEITAWSWVDTQDAIDPDANVLALPGVSEESPALYGDIVALLPAEITATTEDGEVTIALGGWTCPDYPEAGAYTGSYTFTASLPEGYVLAADAPALTVTVELDDEVMLMAEGTTHAESHPPCGASCTDTNTKHYDIKFPNWLASDYGTGSSLVLRVGGENHSTYGDPLDSSGSAWTLPEGTYYLADDIRIDKPIKIYGDVTICLNGHDISVGKDIYAFEIDKKNAASPSGKLILTDCKENRGEVKSYDTDNPAYGGVTIISSKNCTFNMYGGTIKGTKRGVYVRDYCTFNMYGGVISDTADCGVVVTDSNATFNMYGGEISRNRNYGVEVEKYAKFNMHGGVIKDITTRNSNANISGVYCKGSYFNMHGGVISGCKRGVHVTCNSDNPNIPVVPGKFTMDGGTIKENEIGVSLYAYFYDNKVLKSPDFTMTGGEIINNTDIGVDMGCYTDGGTNSPYGAGGHLFVGGTAKVQSNSKYNVYFDFSKGEIKLATSAALTEGAYIGITTGTLPTEGNPLLIATVTSPSEVAGYFHSDRDGYVIKCADTDSSHTTHTLNLTVSPHTHNWQYTNADADKSTISVTCNGNGTCAYKTTPATVSIRTAKPKYDYETITEAPKAVLTYSDNWPDGLAKAQESAIEYYKRADDGNNYNLVYNKEDLKNPGYYLAQLDFVKGSKYLVTYFSVVDNRKTDPQYTAPTAITGLTYNGQEQDLITPGSATGGTMQYKLDTADAYSTFIPTATNAGTYTVYYKVVGDATHNDTAEQSITVTIGKASLTGAPTFTPVTEAGKTIGDVTPNVPAGWHGGVLYWYGEGEAELDSTTLIKQGASYEWFFKPADSNYQGIGGKLVLWADTSGDSSSNPGDGNSSNTSGGGSNTGGSSSDDGNTSDIGNSNNGSSNANIPPTPVTVPVSGDEKTIQVDAVVSGTTATIKNVDLSKLDTVIGDTVKNGVVTIDFSVLKKVDNVKLPSNVVKQIAEAVNEPDNDAKDLEIVLANGTSIKLDAKMLGEKNVKANGVDITISIKRITGSSLNIKQKQAVGSRPALDINVTIGGKPISDMNGKVTVSAAYELKPGEHASGIVVSYVDANGNRQLCETSYDPIRKQVSWKTGSLSPSSVYMIGYDESRVRTYVTYTVQKGSTLSMIAKKHGCTVADIMAANSGLIKNPNRIFEGWQLKIPQD